MPLLFDCCWRLQRHCSILPSLTLLLGMLDIHVPDQEFFQEPSAGCTNNLAASIHRNELCLQRFALAFIIGRPASQKNHFLPPLHTPPPPPLVHQTSQKAPSQGQPLQAYPKTQQHAACTWSKTGLTMYGFLELMEVAEHSTLACHLQQAMVAAQACISSLQQL